MTALMIVAFLSSIAIVRRILMATSVLKASYFLFMRSRKENMYVPSKTIQENIPLFVCSLYILSIVLEFVMSKCLPWSVY